MFPVTAVAPTEAVAAAAVAAAAADASRTTFFKLPKGFLFKLLTNGFMKYEIKGRAGSNYDVEFIRQLSLIIKAIFCFPNSSCK